MRKFALLLYITAFSLLSIFPTFGQESFVALNGIPGGSFTDIQQDTNDRLYVEDNAVGIVYYSDDRGSSWQELDLPTRDLYAFYVDGSDLYYFTYNKMYKSIDDGSTWTLINSDVSFRNIRKVHKSPAADMTWIAECPCEGIFISTDDGISWYNIVTETCGSGSDGSYLMDLNSNGDIYFVNERLGVLRHKNPTDNIWESSKVELVFPKLITGSDNSLDVKELASGNIIIAHRSVADEYQLSISSSGDVGTFTALALPSGAGELSESSLNLDFNGKLHVVGKYTNEVYELEEESTPVWKLEAHPLDLFETNVLTNIYWMSASEVFACAQGPGMFRSVDGGASWQMRNGTGSSALLNGRATDIEVLSNGNIVVFPGGAPKGSWVMLPQENNFSFHTFGERAYTNDFGNGLFKLQDGSLLIRGSESGLMRSTDGQNWVALDEIVNAEQVLPIAGGEIFLFNGAAPLQRTTITDLTDGGGITLIDIPAGLPTNMYVRNVVEHQGDFYMDLYNNDNDQAELWKIETSESPFTSQKLITPFPTDNLAGIVSVSNKLYLSNTVEVAISSDQGVSWSSIEYTGHGRLLGIDQENGGIALSTTGSLVVTQDDGVSWRTFATPLNGRINVMAQDAANNFIAATDNAPVSIFESQLVLKESELPAPISISWEPLNGPFGGQIDGLTRDSQNNIFAYSDQARVFRLGSGSSKWEQLNTFETTGIVYVADNDDVYIANWNSIQKSGNNGDTWDLVADETYIGIVNLVIADNDNIIITSNNSGEGLYVTTDGGASFSKPLGPGTKGDFYELIKSGTGKLWTHQRNNDQSTIYTSLDHGITWATLENIDLSNGKRVLSLNVLEGNTVAIVTEDDILRSTDDGATWTSILGTITQTATYTREPALSRVYLATDGSYFFHNLDQVYRSDDQGTNWSEATGISRPGFTITGMVWRGNDIIASTDRFDGIVRSIDGDTGFTPLNNGLTAHFNNFRVNLAPSGAKIFASDGGYGEYFESKDKGLTFTNDGLEVYYQGILKDPNGKLIRYGSGLSYSIDNGASWSENVGDGTFDRLVTSDGETYFALFRPHDTDQREIVKSTDLVNWSSFEAEGLPFEDDLGFDYMVPFGDDLLYLLTYNYDAGGFTELYKIAFGSAEKINSPQTDDTQVLQYFNGRMVLYGSVGKLTYSEDGTNWIQLSAPQISDGSQFRISRNGYYFLNDTRTGSLWVSRDEGQSWQAVDGFNVQMHDIEVDPISGFAYALVRSNPILRSSDIVLEDDGTNPAFAAVGALFPENGDINISLDFDLLLTFNEPIVAVAGKKMRLLESDNPGVTLEIFDATEGSISPDGKSVSFSPSVNIDFATQYFVVLEPGTFTDIFGNDAPGLPTSSDWTFTTAAIPDTQDPTITVTTSDLTYMKGTPKSLEINVTDNQEVDALGASIYYRKISAPATVAFQTAGMASSGNDAPSLDFSISTEDSWYDPIGLEFYFTATDKAGNIKRLPADSNSFLYSYIDYSAEASRPKVEGLIFGATASSYRIIAVPFELPDDKISTVFADLGEPNKERYRIGSYNNQTKTFDEYPESLTDIGRGVGYWILQRNFTEIVLKSASSAENNRNNFFIRNLQAGWNQIGNPYPVEISWEEIRAQNSNVRGLKVYNNGTFEDASTLNPFQGGFVYADADVNNLIYRFPGILSGGRTRVTTSDLSAESWDLTIEVSQGLLKNATGGIGMRRNANIGLDTFDDFNPPSIFDRLELVFKNQDNIDLARSVVPQEENYVWSFTSYAEGSDDTVLSWDNDAFGDNDVDLWLYDEVQVNFINMREENSYGYRSGSPREFKIYYGDLAEIRAEPSFSLLGQPWPNPALGSIHIPFAIKSKHGKATVAINVINSQGQLIKQVANQYYDAGTHQVEWDPASTETKPGLYLIEWKMTLDSGEQLREIKRVIVK